MREIILRKIKKSDLKYFLKWWQDEELIKLTSGIREESEKILIGYFFNILKAKKDQHYIILLDKKIIGHIAAIRKNKSTFEMQIIIGESNNRGKGYGKMAINQALKIAFNKLYYKKAYIEVRPENIRAIEAYGLCGFIKKGIKYNPTNKFQPRVLKMELLKSEFNKSNIFRNFIN